MTTKIFGFINGRIHGLILDFTPQPEALYCYTGIGCSVCCLVKGRGLVDLLTSIAFPQQAIAEFVRLFSPAVVSLYLLIVVGFFLVSWRKYYQNIEISLKYTLEFQRVLEEATVSENVKDLDDRITLIFENAPINNQYIHSLKQAWEEFKEGTKEGGPGEKPWNVYQAEEFFTEKTLQNLVFSNVVGIPGFLTSLGLLFTFVALSGGLKGLHYDEGTKQITAGLGEFIEALGGKFITSLLGIFCAVSVNKYLEDKRQKFNRSIEAIILQLNSRFRRLTSAQVLLNICETIQDLPDSIEASLLRTDGQAGLIEHLKNAMEATISSPLRDIDQQITRIEASVSQFSTSSLDNMKDTFKEIATEIKESIRQGVTGDLTQLSDSLATLPRQLEAALAEMGRSLAEVQANSARSQQALQQHMTELLNGLRDQSGEALQRMMAELTQGTEAFQARLLAMQEEAADKQQALQSVLREMVETVQQAQRDGQSSLDDQLRTSLERFTTAFGDQLAQMQRGLQDAMQAQQQTSDTLMQGLQETFSRLSGENQARQASQTEELMGTLKAMAGTLQETLDQAATRQMDASRETLSVVAEHTSRQQELSQAHLGRLQDESRQWLDLLTDAQAQFQAQVQTSQESFQRMAEQAWETQTQRLKPILATLDTSLEKLRVASDQMPEALRRGTQDLNAAFGELKRLIGEDMRGFATTQTQLLTKHQQVHDQIAQQLQQAAALQKGSGDIQGLLGQVVALHEALEDARKHHASELEVQSAQLVNAMTTLQELTQKQYTAQRAMEESYGKFSNVSGQVIQEHTEALNRLPILWEKIREAHSNYIKEFTGFHQRANEVFNDNLSRLADELSIAVRQQPTGRRDS
jgi:chromosome segregation ATPase